MNTAAGRPFYFPFPQTTNDNTAVYSPVQFIFPRKREWREMRGHDITRLYYSITGAVLRALHQAERGEIAGHVQRPAGAAPGDVPRAPRERPGQEGRVRLQDGLHTLPQEVMGSSTSFVRSAIFVKSFPWNRVPRSDLCFKIREAKRSVGVALGGESQVRGCTLAVKPKADIATSPKQEHH